MTVLLFFFNPKVVGLSSEGIGSNALKLNIITPNVKFSKHKKPRPGIRDAADGWRSELPQRLLWFRFREFQELLKPYGFLADERHNRDAR